MQKVCPKKPKLEWYSYKSAIFMICLNLFQKNEHFEGIQRKTEFTKIDKNS